MNQKTCQIPDYLWFNINTSKKEEFSPVFFLVFRLCLNQWFDEKKYKNKKDRWSNSFKYLDHLTLLFLQIRDPNTTLGF